MGEAESRGIDNVRVLSLSTHVIKSQRTRWSCVDHVSWIINSDQRRRYLNWQDMVNAWATHSSTERGNWDQPHSNQVKCFLHKVHSVTTKSGKGNW